jgi:hypothetical protein
MNRSFSLSVRNYRWYLWGQSISVAGTWMQTLALSFLRLTGSGTTSALPHLAPQGQRARSRPVFGTPVRPFRADRQSASLAA